MENLKLDDTKGESSQSSDLASLNLSGSKPRDGIRDEWRNLEVSYSDIKDLTDNFSDSLVIGKGGFGKVYQAKHGGRTVAIKILDSKSTQGQREFFQEIEVLCKMRHPNLVKLVGACFEEVRALIYEYLPNGSLEDCLKDSPKTLTWQMRTRIIYEICSAISYLHSNSVIHADLKPANVLLDANFKSKLSDFGLCRLLPEDMATARYLETNPMGTPGYTDPWFLDRCILRPGSDLYSLGITVLKLLTGMSPIGLSWKIKQADKHSLPKMIDPTAGNWPSELAKEMAYWSLQCCYHNEDSSKVLMDMSTCLLGMLDEIETLQGGKFKREQTIRDGSGGLEQSSHNNDKEVMGATNPPSSSSSVSEPLPPTEDGLSAPEPPTPNIDTRVEERAGGKLVQFDGPFVFRLDDFGTAIQEVMWSSSYWTLYMFTLEDGNQFVLKEIKDDFGKGRSEFEKEVNVLGKIRHANLSAVRSYCCAPEEDQCEGHNVLFFDFMPKGSLATFMHDRGTDTGIDWPTRMNIAMGTARGLNYIHSDMNIIHGNLSSANVFLDDNNNAKISDYELSRLITAPAESNVIDTAGALGYRAPELSKNIEKANTKTDVYSLGVIVLELLTGKSPGKSTNGADLPQWAASNMSAGWAGDVLDPELVRDQEGVTSAQVDTLLLALDCVSSSPKARPEAQQVLQKLEEIQADSDGGYLVPRRRRSRRET